MSISINDERSQVVLEKSRQFLQGKIHGPMLSVYHPPPLSSGKSI